MATCEANIWRPRTQCENLFEGVDPTLADGDAAIIIGSEDVDQPHTAEGPTLSQAKTNSTTAAKKLINTLGGDVDIGGTGSLVQAWNPDTATQERVLTLTDRFFEISSTPVTGTAHTVLPTDVAKRTQCTNAAAVTITIDDSSAIGVALGQEAVFFSTGAAGIIQFLNSGAQSLITPASGTAVPLGRTASVTLIAPNTWLYTGP